MSDTPSTIADMLNTWVGGAFTTIIGATIGRVMFHAQEVRKAKRKPFGRELIWELPVAIGTGMLADAVASYMGFSSPVGTGIAVGLGYLGPRGIEVLFMRWFDNSGSAK